MTRRKPLRTISQNSMNQSSNRGPRMDVLLRIVDRVLEFEEEVRTGRRIITETGSKLVDQAPIGEIVHA